MKKCLDCNCNIAAKHGTSKRCRACAYTELQRRTNERKRLANLRRKIDLKGILEIKRQEESEIDAEIRDHENWRITVVKGKPVWKRYTEPYVNQPKE